MKKIPTVFERIYENHKVVGILPNIREDLKLAFYHGDATIKFDGSCCAIINGELYKRFDYKPGRKLLDGAIPCQESADPVTGHFPHWVKCSVNNSSDKWFIEAFNYSLYWHRGFLPDGTYEAIGKHFNGNPYNYEFDELIRHGFRHLFVERNFDAISRYLHFHNVEGIVFWYNGKPVCKIKRTDFGYKWPIEMRSIEDVLNDDTSQ